MQKIAAIFDGLKFSESTLYYAVLLAKEQQAHLTGIFPDDFTYNSFSMYELLKSGVEQAKLNELEEEDKAKRIAAAATFEAACKQAGISYNMHQNKNISLLEVLQESIYADLLIIDAHETFARVEMAPPTRFIRDLLVDVQCPVLIVPSEYHTIPSISEIEKVVLLYDGEPSSVYAIKMFSYVMPLLQQLPVTVLSVNYEGNYLSNKELIRDFIIQHYPQANFEVMEGVPEEKIPHYLKEQTKGTLAVLGAYRRGAVSRWFRSSMADELMQFASAPLFVAHNK
ncbi:universal stress protein [Chitinophaga sp. 30R24]|uniref:universal stress protein n=1 Tax=Chitinophaga sp. 30R24 TaxID=3248838 RepID=UPI003B8F4B1C